MRQWLYGCIAVLVLTGIIAYGFLSAPKVIRLEQEMQVTAYKLQEAGYAKTVTVTLKGAYAEKTHSYTGKLAVNGVQYKYCDLNPERGFMICAREDAGGEYKLLGQVFADSGFQTWSLALQKGEKSPGYESNSFYYAIYGEDDPGDDSIILSYPSADRDTAIQQYESLQSVWQDQWERRVK
ncbi:hypothetical protein MKZ24_24675 [Paenibacillus sp. FSL R7-0297]|uniref:hypothetical protein n=1 Tax=unclassified Paenibacillus TaxID=185978 RepID=UPI0004F6514E|nr:hypothetical protein [Paenibacillus sp. FSL R5-0912]AIQ40973.1 hypothetical protein R50912_13760 [Paenibacillus sp. FSL R5-0912]